MTDTSPIKKQLDLKVPTEKAFRHFTENIHLWWPLQSHSLGQELAERVTFEGREGGRLYETEKDGREREWGTVKTYAPFTHLVFSWALEKPDRATEVEVQFEVTGDVGCRMTLVHRGWDMRTDGAEKRAGYLSGWDGVLDKYQKHCQEPKIDDQIVTGS